MGPSDAERPTAAARRGPSTFASVAIAALLVGVATLALSLARDLLDLADVAMVYLVAIAAVASRLGRVPSLAASVLSVVALDFFFVPPFHAFHVDDLRHVITFAVLLGAGVSIAALTEEARRSANAARRAITRADEEELRSSILSAVSHDLRTPLAVVTGAASTLLDERAQLAPGVRQELLRSIGEESARIERLIHNALEMSRLEGDARIDKEWVPVEEIVGSALTRSEKRLEGRPVGTALPSAPWRVAVDPVLFEQVLVNLLDNAAKHTPAGTPVDITVGEAEGQLVIEVSDRGPGVPGDIAPRIFEKFERGGGGAGGAGLGLAICRAVVRAHGGAITVAARPGGGATFRVVLPTFDAGTAALAEAAKAAEEAL